MYTYFLMISILLLILYINIKVYKFDLLSPSFLYTAAMLLSSILALIGLLMWNNVSSLSYTTIFICILSVLSFNAGELLIRKVIKSNKENKVKKASDYININISWWKIIIQLIFVVITLLLVYHEVYRIATEAGFNGNGISNMIEYYRNTTILFSTQYIKNGVSINIIVAQMQKIVEVICCVNIFLVISAALNNNLKNKRVILYSMIILISVITSLLTGGRMRLVIYVLFTMVIIIIKLNQKYDYKELIKKYKKIIIIFFLASVVSFYCALPMLGRKTDTNIIEYTTFYFGAPIPSLEKVIHEQKKPSFFGEETFRGVQNVAFKLGLSDFIQPISTEWVYFYTKDSQKLSSNIYTAAKRYYHDFGLIGVFILQLINGAVFAALYVIMKKRKTIVLIIFYAMYLYMIIDQVRDEHFYSNFIHVNTIFKFVVLALLLWFIKYKFKDKKNENKNRKLN